MANNVDPDQPASKKLADMDPHCSLGNPNVGSDKIFLTNVLCDSSIVFINLFNFLIGDIIEHKKK